MIKDYKDLEVWKIGMQLKKEIHQVSGRLAKEEHYWPAIQLRKSASAIASNISECRKGVSLEEYTGFLEEALGSVRELEGQLTLCHKVHQFQIPPETFETTGALGRKLKRLIQSLRN